MKKVALFVFVVFMSTALFAQSEEPAPKKHDATWHQVVHVKFKAGKVGEAKKIISRFQTAAAAAGTSTPNQYWYVTGSYDMMLIWDLKGGPSDLEWAWSPNGVKWWKAFVEQEGSEEAAQKLQDEYRSFIAGSTNQIIRKDN